MADYKLQHPDECSHTWQKVLEEQAMVDNGTTKYVAGMRSTFWCPNCDTETKHDALYPKPKA